MKVAFGLVGLASFCKKARESVLRTHMPSIHRQTKELLGTF